MRSRKPIIYLITLLCACCCNCLAIPILYTTVGNAAKPPGFGGDGSVAAAAILNQPVAVALDPLGNLYIADKLNNRIRRVDKTTNTITTMAGNGTVGFSGDGGLATAAQLNGPGDLCVDYNGNIVFVDSGNQRIRSVNKVTGIISTIAGNGGSGYSGQTIAATSAGIGSATGITDAPYGAFLYISLGINARICKLDIATGILSTIAGNGTTGFSGDNGPATNATFDYPMGIAAGSAQELYIADRNNQRIREIDMNGIITTVAGNGTAGYSAEGLLAINAPLNFPTGVFKSFNGLLIADRGNNRIRRVDPYTGGIYTAVGSGNNGYGGDGFIAFSECAKLSAPNSVKADATGNLYIADMQNNCIRKVDITTNVSVNVSIQAMNNPFCKGTAAYFKFAINATNFGPGSSSISYQTYKVNGVVAPDLNLTRSSYALKDGDVVTFEYTVEPHDLCGSITFVSNPVVMHVEDYSPAVAITADTNEICAGSPVSFTATPTDGGTSPSYQWQVNGKNTGTNSPTFTTTALRDNDLVTCLLKSSVACAANVPAAISNGISMTVHPLVATSIAISSNSNKACKGQTVVFTANPTNGGSGPAYQWKVNGANVGSNSTMFTSASLNDGDVVACVLQVGGGVTCATDRSPTSNPIKVTVLNAVGPSVSITASNSSICSGDLLRFTAAAQNTGSNPIYQWEVNGINMGGNSPMFSSTALADGDMVACTVTAPNAACLFPATSNTIAIRVKPLPIVAIKASDTVAIAGTQVQLTGTVTGNISSYTWAPASLLTNASTLSPLTLPINLTTTYTLNVKDTAGCTATASITVHLYFPLSMPSAFTPNGDGNNDIFRIPPTITPLQLDGFSVYNKWGGKVFTTKDAAKGWDGKLNGEPLPTGTFVYTVEGMLYGKRVSLKGTVILLR